MKSHVGPIRACFEHELKAQPSLTGRLKTRWTIHPSGTVCDVVFEEDTMNLQSMRDCVARKIQNWKFPPPQGGSVEIVFPFVFEIDEPAAPAPAPGTTI